MKLHELLITDQLWVVESDWLVEIQLKLTCARPFSRHALTPPTSGVARKGSSSIDYDARLLLSTHVNLPTSTLCLVLTSSPAKFSTYSNVTDEKMVRENFVHLSIHSLCTRTIRPGDKASQVYNELCGNAFMLSAGTLDKTKHSFLQSTHLLQK